MSWSHHLTIRLKKQPRSWEESTVGRFLSAKNDRLVGMVTDRDITLRAVAKGNPPDHCTVREVMSPDIKYVFEDEATEAAAESMSKLQVRRLPVLNRQKRLVGIVSLGDLALKHKEPAANALQGISKPNGTTL